MAERTDILSWLHIGDLHITRAGEENHRDLLRIVEPAGRDWTALRRHADGSDADRVGAWPEKGIFDTQLGPNRNGRNW